MQEAAARSNEKAAAVENAKVQRLELGARASRRSPLARPRRAKDLKEQEGKIEQLDKAYDERRDNFGKELFAMPIIDAFGRPLKVEQIWLPQADDQLQFSRRGPVRPLHHLPPGAR